MRGWLNSVVRDASNGFVRFDPLMRRTFRQAKRIHVTSGQTLAVVPRHHWKKTAVQLAVGIDHPADAASGEIRRSLPRSTTGLRVLYVGRMLYWKGMHLGIAAFARLAQRQPNARLTMVGSGPDEKRWRRLAERLGVQARTEWLPWIDREELATIYGDHDVLLFPSLHDSGGMVVLEALAHGLPVVCLDLGGPGTMVNASCGCVIETAGKSGDAVVQCLADALTTLSTDADLYARLSAGAAERARELSWRRAVSAIYQPAAANGTPAAPE